MSAIARATLIALTLAVPLTAHAQTRPPKTQPSSYAPGPRSGPHVYGAPIGAPIVGPARPAHQTHAAAQHRAAVPAQPPRTAAAKRRPTAPAHAPT
jgi:hypothetical protein